ncbi:MAG: hypothetical protein JEY91_02570 [Spirochaetaceae bacterium]|nr:hypothetical protein [Spirochaetaceae bacterium]
MFIRKKGFISMLVLSLLLLLSAFMTIIPFDQAEKINLLGYKALHSLSPVSTIVLIVGSIVVNYLRKRYFLTNR